MKIHEHQAKEIFRKFGVAVPRGAVAFTPAEAEAAAAQLGTPIVVVKAQCHAGGRGKGVFAGSDVHGVVVARDPAEVRRLAESMLGRKLVTVQTGPAGTPVRRLLIEEGIDIAAELYLGLVVDRERERVCVMASAKGGMEIEKVAAESPEAILKEWVDPAVGLQDFQARNLVYGLGLPQESAAKAVALMKALYRVFVENDCSLVEVNPLVRLKNNDVLALDAKINFDDSGLFRHPELLELKDATEENPLDAEAAKHDLNYIKLEGGSVGCMVNGAGLAMATMDILLKYGGRPANFLDVGGDTTAGRVSAAFKIISSDSDVQGILINIFGGIVRCDVIAQGIVAAAAEVGLRLPMVVRLAGTNQEEGRSIVARSGLQVATAETMDEAARKVVELAAGRA